MNVLEKEIRDGLRWVSSDVLNLEFRLTNEGYIEQKLIDNIIRMMYTVQELNTKLKEEQTSAGS